MRKAELLAFLFAARSGGEQAILAGANLHGLYMFETEPEYRALLERPSTIVLVDGMPVIWLMRLLGHRVRADHRTTWVDWFEDALARAARENRSVHILGHTEVMLDRGIAQARARWPTLTISGSDGFFDVEDEASCLGRVEAINRRRPDFLFVGMGMPRQEIFVARYADRIEAPLIGLAGAAFAYFAGDQATAPRWMGRLGLEWLYRMGKDPRRLAGRYLVEPGLLAVRMLARLGKKES